MIDGVAACGWTQFNYCMQLAVVSVFVLPGGSTVNESACTTSGTQRQSQ